VKTVLFAWELGGNLGHLGEILPVATALHRHGHRVTLALRDLGEARPLLQAQPFALLPAPVSRVRVTGRPPSASYAEVLLKRGYLDLDALLPLVDAWNRLFEQAQPDLLITSYAPTALVAARGRGFPVAMLGTGFYSPPRAEPIPPFRTWEPVPIARLVQSERLALETINRVLAARGQPPLGRLADLFDLAEDFLCTFPELDHYAGRMDQRYWLPLTGGVSGVAPAWPRGDGARVSGYLRAGHRPVEGALAALRESELRAVVFVPDLAPRVRSRWAARNLVLSERPIDLGAAFAQADLFVGYAGLGTALRALLAGVPMLSLPMHAEQFITAMNVQRLGAGLVLPEHAKPADVRAALLGLAGEPSFREAARRFAARHADYDPAAALEAIVARCEELLG
jgi:UDP:flavonoid glycosyltransferase YjiC (YdhE family)